MHDNEFNPSENFLLDTMKIAAEGVTLVAGIITLVVWLV